MTNFVYTASMAARSNIERDNCTNSILDRDVRLDIKPPRATIPLDLTIRIVNRWLCDQAQYAAFLARQQMSENE